MSDLLLRRTAISFTLLIPPNWIRQLCANNAAKRGEPMPDQDERSTDVPRQDEPNELVGLVEIVLRFDVISLWYGPISRDVLAIETLAVFELEYCCKSDGSPIEWNEPNLEDLAYAEVE